MGQKDITLQKCCITYEWPTRLRFILYFFWKPGTNDVLQLSSVYICRPLSFKVALTDFTAKLYSTRKCKSAQLHHVAIDHIANILKLQFTQRMPYNRLYNIERAFFPFSWGYALFRGCKKVLGHPGNQKGIEDLKVK